MKRETIISTIILLMMAGIGGCKQAAEHSDGLITIDLAANYPLKELVLQDFLDVEYIPLETNDEFITQGNVMVIGNQYILAKNWFNDGDIFVFDRKTGRGIRKINRKGQGAEEYNSINGVVLDEYNNEIFINSSLTRKIFVYDLSGNYKRSFKYANDASYLYVSDYDRENLICYDVSIEDRQGENRGNQSYHMIISKQDGTIARSIPIPFDVVNTPRVEKGDAVSSISIRTIIPNHGNWLLVETSSDTVYNYLSKENKLIPFLVKTPSTNPEIFLTMGTVTDRFYFMQTIKNEYDFATKKGFPKTALLYDNQEGAVFNVAVYNGDYVEKQEVNMTYRAVNGGIASYQILNADELVEAYENGELRGNLKEITAGLDAYDNPVIMLMKYKK